MAELYSERMKCPSADRRIERQKISSDCCPHSTSGRAAALSRKRAWRGTRVATSSTSARKVTRRSGDKLKLPGERVEIPDMAFRIGRHRDVKDLDGKVDDRRGHQHPEPMALHAE